jgi:hypothetical protein
MIYSALNPRDYTQPEFIHHVTQVYQTGIRIPSGCGACFSIVINFHNLILIVVNYLFGFLILCELQWRDFRVYGEIGYKFTGCRQSRNRSGNWTEIRLHNRDNPGGGGCCAFKYRVHRKLLAAHFSLRRPEFNPRRVHEGFVVDNVGLSPRHGFLQVFWFSPIIISLVFYHPHHQELNQ